MKLFSKIVKTLACLGMPKPEGDATKNVSRVLTDDYEIEQRALLYRDKISRADIGKCFRQTHPKLPVLKISGSEHLKL